MPESCKQQIGGQAVIEGVMMKSRHFWSVAVRKPNQEISTSLHHLNPASDKYPFLGWIFIRGIVSLVETMSLGFKALGLSVNEATEEEVQFSRKEMAISIILAVVFAVGIFFVLPTLIGRTFSERFPSAFIYNLLEGLIRIGFFLVYVVVISAIRDVKRLFQYHGAEHKTIQAYEMGQELTVENIKKFSRLHVRCGTSFLFIVMLVAIFVFALLGKPPMALRILSRVLLIPVIAGISFELIKLAGKFSQNRAVNVLFLPGLLLQKLTTREPDEGQLEVASKSFLKVLEAEEQWQKNKEP